MLKIFTAACAGLMLTLAAGAATAHPAEGDWLGVLNLTPQVALHMAVHIHRTADGAYAGTIDSLDQGAFDAPLSEITATPNSLSFSAPNTKAHYALTWNPAAGGWSGQRSQGGQSWAFQMAPGVAPPQPVVDGLDGDWDGTLNVSLMKLRLAFHFKTGVHGTLGTMDSIDEQATGAGVGSIRRNGDKVHFELPLAHIVIDGDLVDGGRAINAKFAQNGQVLPLVLTRRESGQAQAALRRPQTPVKPYPYAEEEVAFDDAPAHVRLAGTLTLPKGAGPFPVVVLVAGSGPNARNEPIMGHQIFLVIADHLTRQGIAVLRYDKRGIGASTGDYAKAATQDFANDAAAAVAYLKTRKDIDPRHIGLIGHSEGGEIVPMVAAHDASVSFIVMMAGPGVTGDEVWVEQLRLILKAAGLPDATIATAVEQRQKMIAILRTQKDPSVAAASLRTLMGPAAPKDQVESLIAVINTPWFRDWFDLDPRVALRQVRCPVLALNGSKDLQVSPSQNLPAIRAALAANSHVEIMELPNLNHLFQTATTGGVSEYGQIEETIAPAALTIISDWVLKQVKP